VAITLPAEVPDTQAPSVPTALAGNATAHGAQLSWTASSDDRAVASYAVYRDGSEIGTTASPNFEDTGAAPGVHAYSVAAEDAAHNRSGVSVPVTVTVPAPTSAAPGASGGSEPGAGPKRFERPRGQGAKADTKPPRIRIKRRHGRRGRVSFRVRATDTGGVTSVELFVGGKRRKAVRLSSAAGVLRYAGRIRRGARIVARATDRSGNRSSVIFHL
jgi:hypothetical protein